MRHPERAFGELLGASLATGALLALPLAITLFPGRLQQALGGYDTIAAVCAAALGGFGLGLPPLGAAVLALTLSSFTLGALRAWRIIRRTGRALARHRPVAAPRRLRAAAAAAGVSGAVVCFDDPRPLAYCRGLLAPRIWISSGTLSALRLRELESVLHHEAEHLRRRDPLRILVGRVLGEIFFAVPLIRVLAARFEVAKELAADRVAVRRQRTARHLAGALYAMGRDPFPGMTGLAVGGWSVGRARVDQLAGVSGGADLLRPSRHAAVLTLATLALAAALGAGQAARANLVPAAIVDAIEPALRALAYHSCPLPTAGMLI